MSKHLWHPSTQTIKTANLTAFIEHVAKTYGQTFAHYEALHQWSVDCKEDFWEGIWDFCDVIGAKGAKPYLEQAEDFVKATFFPRASLNYAENVLRGLEAAAAHDTVIVFWDESGFKRSVHKAEFLTNIAKFQAWFKEKDLKAGDRVCALVPNTPESLAAMLAASSLGLVWASCSPDFGVEGVLDRFVQITPKVLICSDGYYYKNRFYTLEDKVSVLAEQLGLQDTVLVFPYRGAGALMNKPLGAEDFSEIEPATSPLKFDRFPFNHPLFIMFSSGTTGKPKCIIHGAGGTLLQHLKEHQLHCDIKPKDRVFYYTTCSWMMWNWHVSAMASGAVLLLFDGFPFLPAATILFDFAEQEKMTLFGTASKYIDALKKRGFCFKESHDLTALRMITSTGGPLVHECFDYIYQNIKQDICVASISGGTDILSCFVLGCPTLPVYSGQIQCRGLGMDVAVYNETGKPLYAEKGELVCQSPFPSKPIGFFNDPDDQKFKESYFNVYPNIWCHGDYAELTPEQGMVIYGRSDTVLNPGGVRIGTAEIYRQVEKIECVVESLAIGQDWEDDMRIILFVVLEEGVVLDDRLAQQIRMVIKENASPRHVPSKIIQVPSVPKTKNGKLVEGVVRNIVHQRPILNKNTLANPECLDYFKDIPELQVA